MVGRILSTMTGYTVTFLSFIHSFIYHSHPWICEVVSYEIYASNIVLALINWKTSALRIALESLHLYLPYLALLGETVKNLMWESILLSCFYAALLPRRGPHIASHSVSVCLSVRPVSGCTLFTVEPSYERTSKIEKTSVIVYGPASRMYFSVRAEGRISYGHLGRTNSCYV